MPLVFDSQQRNPNILINGDMAIAQRGTTQSFGAGAGNSIAADRWLAYQTAAASASTLTQNSGSSLTGLPFFTRYQRNAGGTGTGTMAIAQNVETKTATQYAGRTLTYSVWARCGSTFSSTSNLLTFQFYTGTGTDESIRTTYTGQVQVLNVPLALTTSFQLFTFTVTVPSNATEFAPVVSWVTTGTAGANDYVDITGFMLNSGGYQTYRGVGSTFGDEVAACQRFYEKTYDLTTVPGTATGAGNSPLNASGQVNGVSISWSYIYKVVKRTSPTITTAYSPFSGAIGKCSAGASDVAVTIGANLSQGVFYNNITSITANDGYVLHITSEAEII